MRGTIVDSRTADEKRQTIAFVVATDRFMSGWGLAPGRSYYAVPVRSTSEECIVTRNMHNRSEMKRVRVVGRSWKPRLTDSDHLHIASPGQCSRFYEPNGF